LEPCPHCFRTFLPEKLKYHMKACTAERPLKKPLLRNEEGKVMGYIEDPDEIVTAKLGLAAREAAQAR
jgi:hypothetical protein